MLEPHSPTRSSPGRGTQHYSSSCYNGYLLAPIQQVIILPINNITHNKAAHDWRQRLYAALLCYRLNFQQFCYLLCISGIVLVYTLYSSCAIIIHRHNLTPQKIKINKKSPGISQNIHPEKHRASFYKWGLRKDLIHCDRPCADPLLSIPSC